MKKLLLTTVAMLLLSVFSFANVLVYDAHLSGPTSPGSGFTQVTIDTVAETMRVEVTFAGLIRPTPQHISTVVSRHQER